MADANLVVAEGRVQQHLELAQQALERFSYEQALVYGVLALAWQQERAEALRCLQGR